MPQVIEMRNDATAVRWRFASVHNLGGVCIIMITHVNHSELQRAIRNAIHRDDVSDSEVFEGINIRLR